jgi:hypothetical protein
MHEAIIAGGATAERFGQIPPGVPGSQYHKTPLGHDGRSTEEPHAACRTVLVDGGPHPMFGKFVAMIRIPFPEFQSQTRGQLQRSKQPDRRRLQSIHISTLVPNSTTLAGGIRK